MSDIISAIELWEACRKVFLPILRADDSAKAFRLGDYPCVYQEMTRARMTMVFTIHADDEIVKVGRDPLNMCEMWEEGSNTDVIWFKEPSRTLAMKLRLIV